MTFAIGIMILAALFAALVLQFCGDAKNSLCCLCFCLALQILLLIWNITPTAMDVYQGNTTLKKTYVNGEAVDSTVVFKEKEK